MLQLRAISSFARVVGGGGPHRDDAFAMLSDAYNSSTEGFDTADLKDA